MVAGFNEIELRTMVDAVTRLTVSNVLFVVVLIVCLTLFFFRSSCGEHKNRQVCSENLDERLNRLKKTTD